MLAALTSADILLIALCQRLTPCCPWAVAQVADRTAVTDSAAMLMTSATRAMASATHPVRLPHHGEQCSAISVTNSRSNRPCQNLRTVIIRDPRPSLLPCTLTISIPCCLQPTSSSDMPRWHSPMLMLSGSMGQIQCGGLGRSFQCCTPANCTGGYGVNNGVDYGGLCCGALRHCTFTCGYSLWVRCRSPHC